MPQRVREFLSSPVAISLVFALFVVGVAVYPILHKSPVATQTQQNQDEPGIASAPSQPISVAPLMEASTTLSLGFASSSSLTDEKREFFRKFLAGEIQQTKQETVDDMVKNFDSSQLLPRERLSDLTISADVSPDALRAYGNAFGAIVKNYVAAEKDMKDETTVIETAMKSKKASDLEPLELPAVSYRNFSDDLRKLTVPAPFAEYHLDIVNGYDVMSRSLFLTEKLLSDPISGAAGWQTYIAKIPSINRGYAGIVNVFHDKGIAFSASDPGYYFRWRGSASSTKTTHTP